MIKKLNPNHFLKIFLCTAFFLLCVWLRQAECITAADILISSTLKSLAKAYVYSVDLEKLKKDNIARIISMNDEKYNREYRKVFVVLKDLPPDMLARYGIRQDMTKEEVVQNIRALDKHKIYLLIDDIPDVLIANEFKKYLSGIKQKIKESSIVQQVRDFWDKAIKKMSTENKKIRK